MQYRPEIDGLRTVAVASVILYHAEFVSGGSTWFTGGFVGVDVFFVISGYLISKIIFAEILSTGRFSLRTFYGRRARRILPALLVVMGISAVFAYFFLLPDELMRLAYSQLATLSFGSNIYFYYSSTEYGAAPALLMPFLHTWSLSVEEQFYIVFPLVVLLTQRLLRGRMALLLSLLLVASFAACVLIRAQDQQFAFFMAYTRAWELLAGSLLALYEIRRGAVKRSILTEVAALVGLAAVLSAIVFFNKDTYHPDWPTIIPVLGSVLVLAFSSTTGISGRILSAPPMRYLGAISYSLYLWHFPIFAFWRLINPEITDGEKLLAIALTFVLSAASYQLIEQPFRRYRNWPIWRTSGLAVVAVAAAAAFFISNAGFPARLLTVVTPEAYTRETALRSQFSNYIGEQGSVRPVIFIVGDSYTPSWSVSLNQYIDHDKFDVVSISYLGCTVTINGETITAEPTSGASYEQYCTPFQRYASDTDIISRTVAVFLASHRPFEYGANLFRFDVMSWLKDHGRSPDLFVFGNYFQIDSKRYPSCLNLMFRKHRDASVCLDLANYPLPGFDPKILRYYPSNLAFTYVDLIGLSCSASKANCSFEKDGMPFMTDWNHLTATFLTATLGEIIKSKRPQLDELGLSDYLSLR